MVEPPAKRDSAKNWLRCAKIEQLAMIDAESCRNNSRIPQRRREVWMTFFRQWPRRTGRVPPPANCGGRRIMNGIDGRVRRQSFRLFNQPTSRAGGACSGRLDSACRAANGHRCGASPGRSQRAAVRRTTPQRHYHRPCPPATVGPAARSGRMRRRRCAGTRGAASP
jgi:hypothetical protein